MDEEGWEEIERGTSLRWRIVDEKKVKKGGKDVN